MFRRKREQSDFGAEIEAHIELETERLQERGLSYEDARTAAYRTFGNVTRVQERFYESQHPIWWDDLLQDIRYALRLLRNKPTFTAAAVLTLALGVGANTVIFSVVNAVLLHSLPFPEPERLVRIFFNNPGTGLHGVRFSVPELEDLRDRSGVFEEVSAIARGSINLTGGSQPQRLEFVVASPKYFSMLRATPQIGRLFGPQEFTPGYAQAAVISDSLWRRDFGADPGVLGRTVHLDSDAYTVVGVLPPEFRHPGQPRVHDVDVWITSGFSAAPDPPPTRSTRALPGALGRLKPGITPAQAQDRLTAMAGELRRDYPTDYPTEGKFTIEIQPLQESMVGNVRPMLLVLQGAVILIAFIVSLNIANLLLARASGRQQEMAVRSALGASRTRIIRQMLTESLLLALLGGAAGFALAVVAMRSMLRVVPSTIPRLNEVTMDWRVLAFALLISVLTGLLFGLAPAVHSTRANLSLAIREGSRGSGHSVTTGRLRDTLIVSELAIAVVLMTGAGLLLRTLRDLLKENPGFNPTQVVAANVNLPAPNDPRLDQYSTIGRQSSFYRELQRRMNAIPGVELAAIVSDLPTAGSPFNFTLGVEDRVSPSGEQLRAEPILISPDYFKVMQTPLVRGRFLTEGDEESKPRVAVIEQSTARRYWPNGDPLGRRLRVGQSPWMTVVGIVNDIKHDGLDTEGVPHIYVSIYQPFDAANGVVFRDFAVVMRTALPVSALAPEVRREVRSIDSGLPVYSVASMNEWLDKSLASRRFSAQLVSGFAALSLLLASIGIYGVLAYMVGQRSREIGLRMALGATRADILKWILRRGIVLAAVGVLAGVILSASAASMMASLLYGVRPHDPAVFLIVPLILLAVGVLASYLPAWRAAKLDPIFALRET
jgi:putative ABC transport system permease protein